MFLKNISIYFSCVYFHLLRGEIAALNHYYPLEGKNKGTKSTLYYCTKKLSSLSYFITTTQVISKTSYQEEWGR
jgi:hypothetical protein